MLASTELFMGVEHIVVDILRMKGTGGDWHSSQDAQLCVEGENHHLVGEGSLTIGEGGCAK